MEKQNISQLKKESIIKKLSIDELYIDSYQRDVVDLASRKLIEKISNNFSFIKCGVLLVSYRASKKKYLVVDGQHRLEGYKLFLEKNEITNPLKLDCQVFVSTDIKLEASNFCDIQIDRKKMTPFDIYKAKIIAKEKPFIDIQNWLNAEDFYVSKTRKDDNNCIRCINLVVKLWTKDQVSLKKALVLERNIFNKEDSIERDITIGFWYLYNKGIDLSVFTEKFKILGGRKKLISEINSYRAEIQKIRSGKESGRTEAIAILNLVNKGRRNKNRIFLP